MSEQYKWFKDKGISTDYLKRKDTNVHVTFRVTKMSPGLICHFDVTFDKEGRVEKVFTSHIEECDDDDIGIFAMRKYFTSECPHPIKNENTIASLEQLLTKESLHTH